MKEKKQKLPVRLIYISKKDGYVTIHKNTDCGYNTLRMTEPEWDIIKAEGNIRVKGDPNDRK